MPRDRVDNYPTLLYSWWCTGFSMVIILTRVLGRKVRSDVLFREDWIMLLALLPLFARMALIHVVLLYGTNNIQTVGHQFTATDLYHRSIGARLVLAARISYAAFIWMSKLTVSEFLKRITIRIWRRSYEVTLQGIRIFLVATFFAVVIATLAECQPFEHYWQVIPDPGQQCRQGYANLISMGTCDIITDILLIAFPIPIMLRSGQTWKRKLQLAALFSLSVIMIAVTVTRVPEVIWHLGRQQYRTVWASSEILASTMVSNAVILGSFVRGKGTKKNKYRTHSVTDSIDRASLRRPTMAALQQRASEEDLFRSLGCRMPDHLQDESTSLPRPAPAALPANRMQQRQKSSRLPDRTALHTTGVVGRGSGSEDSLHKLPATEPFPSSPAPSTKESASFFDVGGLLEDRQLSLDSRPRSTTIMQSSASDTIAHDFAPLTPGQSRRGSRAFVPGVAQTQPLRPSRHGSDDFVRRHSDAQSRLSRHESAPMGVLGPMLERRDSDQSLQDAGGLLGSMSMTTTAPSLVDMALGTDMQSPEARPHRPARAQQSSRGRGGLSRPTRPDDASAPAIERVVSGPQQDGSSQKEAGSAPYWRREPDDLDLHDPGGLLR